MAVGWASARPLLAREPLRLLRGAAGRAHGPGVELAAVAFVYVLYQAGRGLAPNEFASADRNAERIADLERTLGISWEQGVQQAASALPPLASILALSYVTLHLGVTFLVLVWLYRRHPVAYARARTTLLGATAIALIVHVAFPTAPPRLAAVGIADTVAGIGVNLSSELLGVFYNPNAAVPSMHFGYALVVGAVVAVHARSRALRALGALYPGYVLLVIVATGNHFLLDAAAGAGVIAAAWWCASGRRLVRRRAPATCCPA